jgi:hypothetical protein
MQLTTALFPRGGGAFLAEVDGDLSALTEGPVVTLRCQGKFRGPNFSSTSFELRPNTFDGRQPCDRA